MINEHVQIRILSQYIHICTVIVRSGIRGDVKILTYRPQKAISELTYFSPNIHM